MSRPAVDRCGWLAVLVAGLGLAASGLALAQDDPREEPKEASLPADLRLISASAGGFACLHAAELWDSDFSKSVRDSLKETRGMEEAARGMIGVAPGDIERLTLVLLTPPPPETKSRVLPDTRPGQRPVEDEEPPAEDIGKPVAILRTRMPLDRDRVLAPLGKTTEKKIGERTVHVGRSDLTVCLLDDRDFVLGSFGQVRLFLSKEPAREGPLSESLKQAAGKHLLVAGLNGSNLHRLEREQMLQQEKLILAMLRPLLQARTTRLVADLDDELHLKLEGTFASQGLARAAAKVAGGVEMVLLGLLQEEVHQILGEEKELAGVLGQLKKVITAAQEAPIEVTGKSLQTNLSIPLDSKLAGFLATMPERMHAAAAKAESINNLKQMGIAMHNYQDSHKTFPPQAICDSDGKLLLSWRVAILPYIDQQALYQQFHLDEPWDSEHNKKLLARMPRVYASPDDRTGTAQHRTHYQGFAGPGAMFEGGKAMRIGDITDGLSRTIYVVEASTSVPWTRPEDLPFDRDRPLQNLKRILPKRFHALFVDGHVSTFPVDADPVFLKRLITRDEGVSPTEGGHGRGIEY